MEYGLLRGCCEESSTRLYPKCTTEICGRNLKELGWIKVNDGRLRQNKRKRKRRSEKKRKKTRKKRNSVILLRFGHDDAVIPTV